MRKYLAYLPNSITMNFCMKLDIAFIYLNDEFKAFLLFLREFRYQYSVNKLNNNLLNGLEMQIYQ